MYGKHVFDWRELLVEIPPGLLLDYTDTWLETPSPISSFRHDFDYLRIRLRLLQNVLTGIQKTPRPLIELLQYMGSFSCTDPRDTCYALLGLSVEPAVDLPFEPDYGRRVEEVFLTCPHALIKSGPGSARAVILLAGLAHVNSVIENHRGC